jgi:hypothetical protein
MEPKMFAQYLSTPEQWKKNRASYMEAARSCREALTVPKYSIWNDREPHNEVFPSDHPVVKEAVGVWVQKSRKAHAFALGRKPVIENFTLIQNGKAASGQLYA